MQSAAELLTWLWERHLGSLEVLSAMVTMPGHMMTHGANKTLNRNRFTDVLENTGCVHWHDGVTPLGQAVIDERKRCEGAP